MSVKNDKISKQIKDNENFFIQTRHHLHEHPELSSQEYETSAYIRSYLDEWKIPYVTNGVSSVIATIKGKKNGLKENQKKSKTIALRGDIDALPIQEETGLAWKSQNDGVMHACGHDVHTTFMLGTAKILNELKDDFNGTVRIIFQEGEEIGAGAKKIMEAGLLSDVDTIVALHDSQEIDLGIFALGYGTMSSFGGGGEVAIETDGHTNALIVAGEFVSLVTALSEEKFSRSEQIVLVPTVVKSAQNDSRKVDKVSIAYNSRTLNLDNEKVIQDLLVLAAEKTSSAFDCKANVELRKPGNAVNNDKHFTDLAADVIKKYFGEKSLRFTRPVMSGEDFALFQKTIPGVYIHIGGATDGVYRALHTSKTCVDDRILVIGIEFFLRYVFEYFS